MLTLTYRHYVMFTALLAFGMIGVIAMFNYLVDPFGLWRAVEVPGLNAAKSERRN